MQRNTLLERLWPFSAAQTGPSLTAGTSSSASAAAAGAVPPIERRAGPQQVVKSAKAVAQILRHANPEGLAGLMMSGTALTWNTTSLLIEEETE